MSDITATQDLDAATVADYLHRHPRFLETHPELATELILPRERGAAASLAAYQVDALRVRNRELNQRLAELVTIAGDNEQLMVRVYALTAGLLRDVNLADTCKRFVATLTVDFQTDWVRLVLFRDGAGLPKADWLLPVPGGAAALPDFAEFLKRGEPACDRLSSSQLAQLFGNDAEKVRSTALLKIGAHGLLAIGSEDPVRFHPGIGTLFLKLIAQALDAALTRFPAA